MEMRVANALADRSIWLVGLLALVVRERQFTHMFRGHEARLPAPPISSAE